MFDCNLLKNGMCINLCIFCLELSCVNFVDIMYCTDIIDVKKKKNKASDLPAKISYPLRICIYNTTDLRQIND